MSTPQSLRVRLTALLYTLEPLGLLADEVSALMLDDGPMLLVVTPTCMARLAEGGDHRPQEGTADGVRFSFCCRLGVMFVAPGGQ